MHIHLPNCKSPDLLSRRLGLNKLELCMIVLEINTTYPSILINLPWHLPRSYRQIFLAYLAQLPAPELATASGPSPMQDAPADNQIAVMTIGEDTIDALMDEVSIFNFWESLNSM